MKLIPLTQSKHAMVDDEDYGALSQFKWHVLYKPALRGEGKWYAARNIPKNGKRSTTYMHITILGITTGIDHRDGNGLNNQRSNLRPATVAQNRYNSRKTYGTSRFPGVYWYAGKWVAMTSINNKSIYIGRFKTEEEAYSAYCAYVKSIGFGEFIYEVGTPTSL